MVDTTSLYPEDSLDIPFAPTEDDLPYDDGEPMETGRHKLQMDVLLYPLMNWFSGQDAFVGGNMFVYFSPEQVKTHDYKGPDVFAVLDVPRRERKSWVVWQEGKGPDVIIELLSPSTARYDKREKKQIYQDRLRVPEYFWYNPFNWEDYAGFYLKNGIYEPIAPDSQGRLISQQLNLALVTWPGIYQDVEAVWLRWATLEGELLPTLEELAQTEFQRAEQERIKAEQERIRAETEFQRAEQESLKAEQERQNAEQERQNAEQERLRAEKLAQKLRELGINPDEL